MLLSVDMSPGLTTHVFHDSLQYHWEWLRTKSLEQKSLSTSIERVLMPSMQDDKRDMTARDTPTHRDDRKGIRKRREIQTTRNIRTAVEVQCWQLHNSCNILVYVPSDPGMGPDPCLAGVSCELLR